MRTMIRRLDWRLFYLGVAILSHAPLATAVDPRDTLLLSDPALSANHIAFVYDRDIWIAERDGSFSRRLTSAQGREGRPRFSRDGTLIAFSANYDGNVDVYVMPVAGGAAKRLTWHGENALVQGFDSQGRVIFSSQHDVYSDRDVHLFAVGADGSFPVRLPIPTASDADITADGQKIAYAIMPPMMFQALTQWKTYRGGSASHIVIGTLADGSIQHGPQPAGRSNDLNPMWIGGKLYFNSDRDGEFNLYRFDPSSSLIQRLTSYADFPVINASAGDDRIIYEQAGRLHIFDPAAGSDTTLHIATDSDLRETRPRWVSNPDYIRNASVSPKLERVALEYRGEIVTVPSSKGAFQNISRSPGANDRNPAWSPSGEKIAWFSDASGEYELYISPQDGSGEPRHIPITGGGGLYEDLKWSPDETSVSFVDNTYSLFIVDITSGKATRIAGNRYFGHVSYVSHNWSPDSRWLAYTHNAEGLTEVVSVYSLAEGKSYTLTDGLTEVTEPVFDPDCRYLYVIASDEAGPVKDWFAQSSLDMTLQSNLYAIALTKDAPSPLSPENDVVEAAQGPRPTPTARVRIDFDGIADRIVALPAGGATLRNLQVGKTGELYYLSSPAIPAFKALTSAADLKRLSLKDRAARTLLGSVEAYHLSPDGEKVLIRREKTWKSAPAGTEIDFEHATALPIEQISVRIDPRQEWHQIAREAWRLNRDFFYAPNYHGVDWNAVWRKYEPFLDHAATRADVGRIISWIASELRVGHSSSTPGEMLDEPKKVPVGLLGADFRIENNRYRFAKIYGGLNWRPNLHAPLRTAGIHVEPGEYLLAVEGRPLTADRNVYGAFENLVGRPVRITVGPLPDGRNSRDLTVVPIASERELRYVDWVESNMRKVDAATHGRVAYVHVPDTSVEGHAAFKRYFYPQSHKDAIILDDRNNGGGLLADYYIDTLRRQPVIEWATRYGEDLRSPRGAIFGPKVMIINEGAGSGGDLLPWMFRKFRLGPLVGARTWGGLVGNLQIHTLMDGGTITAPNIAGWTEEDGWVIENEGVAPEVSVEETPQSVRDGRDPQLEKAIEIALRQLDAHTPLTPKRPPYPARATSGDSR